MEEEGGREDQLLVGNKQHVCKFCSKSFACGRSLGGHMRSHITSSTNINSGIPETEEKLITTINGGSISVNNKIGEYDLRENPKKTWRFADSSRNEETSSLLEDNQNHNSNKICKECGRSFQSCKALFGHMKCHSDKERVSVTEDQDSSSLKMVTDSQSENEATAGGAAVNRRRRSKRRTRYLTPPSTTATAATIVAASSSSLSFANTLSSVSVSVSEVEQEQEEVAISLMMLSRDVSNWGGFNFNSSSIESKGKTMKPMNIKERKKQEQLDFESALMEEDSEDERKKTKKKEISNFKRGKFKCSTCNKIFHSYQALGGHRASHKKMKGCSGVRNEITSENSIEETTITTANINGYEEEEDEEAEEEEEEEKKKHECPICLKVFSSGQALGGHKRSHLGGGSSSLVVETQAPVQEIRDFLDLNLPANPNATEEEDEEEEENEAQNYRPWWVMEGTSHKQQEAPLVGLI